MATIPQIRLRLLEAFPENQADLLARVVIESHDDLVNRADFHQLTGVVKELADAQKELADAQKELADAQKELADAQARTEARVEELADAQARTEARVEQLADAQARTEIRVEELAAAQTKTELRLAEVVQTQNKMLIRLDRLDGHMLENSLARNLPAYLGRDFRRCRVIDRVEFVEGLEGRLAEEELADLLRADIIATARRQERDVYVVVEASCTADADDLDRAMRRSRALASVGFTAIGIVACEMISPQTLEEARRRGLRVIASGWLLPEAA